MNTHRNLNDYISGFVDGEGCFSLTFRKDVRKDRKYSPVYYSWKAMFAIEVRKDDAELLGLVQRILGCGSVTYTKRGSARYQVSGLEDLRSKVIPFFEEYALIGKKKHDFKYWKEAVEILYKKKRNPEGGNEGRLEALHAAMRPYKAVSADKPLRRRPILVTNTESNDFTS